MDNPKCQRTADLERFRGYLRVLARLQAGPRLQGKFDASDIVQQTLVHALDAFPQLKGENDAAVAAWLREILASQLANTVRDLGRQKRDAMRERSLELALDQSASRLERFLATTDPSPSQQVRQSEQVLLLADALAGLPEAQREAIVGHHLEGRTLGEVAIQMERSPVAVAGLIKRGLRALRLRMQDSEGEMKSVVGRSQPRPRN
jgi:RNA polymerase sigma-70 factor (ECF subfamily)